MIDYWSVVVDCLRSKVKGLNPLQIYNMKQALSSILTIIFSTFDRNICRVVVGPLTPFTHSRINGGVNDVNDVNGMRSHL